MRADVLVIGAGPAGSAAAARLAAGGAQVALVDRGLFPREKACGDALIPDALRALRRLSLEGPVLARARVLNGLRIYAPNGRFVHVDGQCACLPRETLDDIIRREAVTRGASFHPGFTLVDAIRGDGVVRGARFRSRTGETLTIEAGVTILATGAAARALERFGVCERASASATAARLYVTTDEAFARRFEHLCISYDRAICPGYGWIFPGPGNVFNVGVGYFYDARRKPPETNIRLLLEKFLAAFPPAASLMRRAERLSSFKGAPLRTGLTGAALATPGLLVVGEAAGLTYPFSGEGIGKALESGMIASEAILDRSSRGPRAVHDIARDYRERIRRAFTPRFRAYTLAQDWLSNPRVADFVAWRARRSRFVQRELEGMFQETSDPRRLFSAAGVVRALLF